MSHWESSAAPSNATKERPDVERNERKLYLVRLHELAGKHEEALRLLDELDDKILDKTGASERKGKTSLPFGIIFSSIDSLVPTRCLLFFQSFAGSPHILNTLLKTISSLFSPPFCL